MRRDTYRRIGAISGLIIAWVAMHLFGFSGVIPAAAFGVAGGVLGGMTGENIHDRK